MGDDRPGAVGFLAGFSAGSRIAGYRLEEQIGKGGMAVVFRAQDERLQRQVALKILSPALVADEEFRRRFIRESRSAAAVDDPHIIPVFEAGDANGVLFIAMRYVPGGDVGTLMRRLGPLPGARAAAIVSAVASALDAAHAAGLVHRDVKPANMLVDARPGRPDHVYLSDFGLTKGSWSSTSMLAGLTSRWTSPAACAASRAEATAEMIPAARAVGSGPSRRSSARTSPPGTYRMAMNSTSPASPASNTGMICGSSTAAADRDSRMKRCRNSSSATSAGARTLSATCRLSRSSCARKTTAIPPRPICSSSRYPAICEPAVKPVRNPTAPGPSPPITSPPLVGVSMHSSAVGPGLSRVRTGQARAGEKEQFA